MRVSAAVAGCLLAASCALPARRWPRRELALADRALHRDRYAEAEAALDAAAGAAARLPPTSGAMTEVHRLRAELHFLRGEHERAQPLYEAVLADQRAAYGADSPEATAALLDLAELQVARGRTAEALRAYSRVLKSLEGLPGSEAEYSARLAEVALLHQTEGRPADAERLLKRALESAERGLGPAHPVLAARLDDLGLLYQSQGRWAEALRAYQRALSAREKALPQGHPELEGALNNLALFHESRGRDKDAEELYRRALAQSERAHGASSPRLRATLSNYAALLRRLGRGGEAADLESRLRSLGGARR